MQISNQKNKLNQKKKTQAKLPSVVCYLPRKTCHINGFNGVYNLAVKKNSSLKTELTKL